MHCEQHPEYKGDNEPLIDCQACWDVFLSDEAILRKLNSKSFKLLTYDVSGQMLVHGEDLLNENFN